MKTLTIIYCGENGLAGEAMGMELRSQSGAVQLRDAFTFAGEAVACDRVIVMPDVPGWCRERIERSYVGLVDRQPSKAPESEAVDALTPAPAAENPPPVSEDLNAEAESLGLKVDKRWREARLRAEIAKAKG